MMDISIHLTAVLFLTFGFYLCRVVIGRLQMGTCDNPIFIGIAREIPLWRAC